MEKQVDIVNHMDSGDPAHEVFDLIHTVMHQFRSAQYQVLRTGTHEVTHMESKVLGFFASHPGAAQSDLAEHSGRDKAQLGKLVKGLRDRGLLTAEADAGDRRSVKLQLSAAGQRVQAVLQAEARRLEVSAVAGLDESRQRELAGMLAQIRANLGAIER